MNRGEMSVAPPASARPASRAPSPSCPPDVAEGSCDATPDGRREIVVELQQPKGWRRRGGLIRLLGSQVTLVAPGILREPLTVAGGLIEVAAVERGPGRRGGDHGRFAVLHRVDAARVLPFEHGIEGWAWTAGGGSLLPSLCEPADAAPNVALMFVKPLGDEEVARCFEPAWLRALADRSPLGAPSISGLLALVADPLAAEEAFRQFGVLGPLTDREIPPTMRRHLPGDKPANPRIVANEQARAQTSVAPPGMA